MATVYLPPLLPQGAVFPSSNFPELRKINGTNFPFFVLAYDPSTAESAFWPLRAVEYGSGDLTLDIEWYADTASANDVVWGASIAAITPNTDTQDVETDSLATENTVTDSHLGTTGQRLHRATITINNLDSLAADDVVFLRIRRVAADGSDTMTGDALLLMATLSYSDT